MSRVTLLVGTKKGAFLLRSNEHRDEWKIEGPLFKGWEVFELTADPRMEGRWLAATGHFIYGSCIQISDNEGKDWKQIEKSPAYSDQSGFNLNNIWCIHPSVASEPDVYYAGVDEAGIFRSEDGGSSWEELNALSSHESRGAWMPGAGGLCCHSIQIDPDNPNRLWTGISAVGVMRSEDRGKSWSVRNNGLNIIAPAESEADVGSCVHALALDPTNSNRLYQQNHRGVYRSNDGGDTWEVIEKGLKDQQFGFPIAVDPHDPDTVFIIPQESDEFRHAADGKLTVCRTTDGGDSWHALNNGLPDDCYTGVLRKAMCTDRCSDTGVYFGSANGQIFQSRNRGGVARLASDAASHLLALSDQLTMSRLEPAAVEIEVGLPSLLREYAEGRDTLTLKASTLKECFQALFTQSPLLERHLFDESGQQREHVLFFLNESDSRWLDSFDHPLQEGDRLTILQAVSGG